MAEIAVDLNVERHCTDFEREGYSVVPAVVTEPEIRELRDAVSGALDADWERYGHLPGKERFIVLDLAHYGGAFFGLLEKDIVDRLFGAILGDRWTLYSFTSTVALPHLEQYTANIHTDTHRLSPGYNLGAVITIALDDFTEQNGATYYLPRSHMTHTEQPDEGEFYAGAVRVCRKAGDAVFFHPRVWHAGGFNATDRVRSGLTVYACRSFMKPRLDFPRFIDGALLDGASDRLRRVLGFDVRVPSSMEEFYRPPNERLYKSGQG
jgi:ectoine hydroxylase-related dioxygenase (phytanoyl-CoA dioxygenase family)